MTAEMDVLLPLLMGSVEGQNFGGGVGQPGSSTPDVGFHQGLIVAWDETTGQNQVQVVGGGLFSNLRVLSTSDSIMLAQGDTVALLKVQSTWFILGAIRAPGAGAGLRARSATQNPEGSVSSAVYPGWVDLSGVAAGPTLSDVYIGSRRMCLVMITAEIRTFLTIGKATFAVTGASNIPASDVRAISNGVMAEYNEPTFSGSQPAFAYVSAVNTSTMFSLLTAADGLNSGSNTFTMKYQALKYVPSGYTIPDQLAYINRRRITVLPL